MHSLLHHTYTCIATTTTNTTHLTQATPPLTHTSRVYTATCIAKQTCMHTHTQAHTHATHAHICTPIAPGLPVAACGRETSCLPNNSLSLCLPQHPYAKMFLCEQGAPCTLTPPNWPSDIHFNTHTQKKKTTKTRHKKVCLPKTSTCRDGTKLDGNNNTTSPHHP